MKSSVRLSRNVYPRAPVLQNLSPDARGPQSSVCQPFSYLGPLSLSLSLHLISLLRHAPTPSAPHSLDPLVSRRPHPFYLYDFHLRYLLPARGYSGPHRGPFESPIEKQRPRILAFPASEKLRQCRGPWRTAEGCREDEPLRSEVPERSVTRNRTPSACLSPGRFWKQAHAGTQHKPGGVSPKG